MITFAIAAATFWLAYDQGTFGVAGRSTLAIAVWWSILIVVALGLRPLVPLPRAALVSGGLLAALAAWTLGSLAWSESAERTFAEFDRVGLYVGVLALVVLASTRGTASRWCDGLAMGIAAIGLLALAARLFPDVFPSSEVPERLPSAAGRLSWPVEYWNGLAILIALAIPLLLRAALRGDRLLVRFVAIAPLPALAATLYLTSSRGGSAAALIGAACFLLLAESRWSALGALSVSALGAAGAIAVLLPRDELVNGPFDSDAAVSEGRIAAILIILACVATAVSYVFGGELLRGFRPPALAGRVATLVAIAAAGVAVAASNPGERLREFREPPPEGLTANPDFVQIHLGSGSGSGRWQYWSAALDEFRDAPLQGRGAGSYEAWWTQHGALAQPIENAHSLYLETLGELGLVGFLLVVGAVASGIAAGVLRTLRAGPARTTTAAITSAFVAYAFGAGVDWMWELTAVSVVGIACLGLLTGPATAPEELTSPGSLPRLGRRSLRTLAALAASLLVCAEAIPLLAEVKLDDSRAAGRRGDLQDAVQDAAAAHEFEPWASTPYLQLALVEERAGRLAEARRWIDEALERDPAEWRLWLVAARIHTESGEIALARRSLHRAAQLNPRSPLFARVPGG